MSTRSRGSTLAESPRNLAGEPSSKTTPDQAIHSDKTKGHSDVQKSSLIGGRGDLIGAKPKRNRLKSALVFDRRLLIGSCVKRVIAPRN